MLNIEKMIWKATDATGEAHELRVVVGSDGWTASITARSGGDDDVVTLESDWNVELRVKSDSIDHAIAALDSICAQDFN